MYFSDLSDTELKYFHNTLNASFSIGLSSILESDLFHCEQIQPTLYRIYPLFYTENIISSNPDDKILDNKCLIVEVLDHETYYSFSKTRDNNNIVVDESVLELYSIGDNLSTDNFNGLVYRLRQRETLTGVLNIEETSVTGLYGTYSIIGGDGRVKNHQGYIINDDLKDNPLLIRLTNPFFRDATYRVTLTIKSITGVNVYEESSESHIYTDELEIILTEDMETMIDVSSYTNDTVLLFDARVDVLFNKPEIINTSYDLLLTTNHDRVLNGDNVTLTATLTSTSGVTGYNVQFYDGNTLLDTKITNSSGVATLTVTPSLGTHVYMIQCLGLTGTVNVESYNLGTTLTVTSAKTKYHPSETGTYTFTLKDSNGSPLTGVTMTVRVKNTYSTRTTDNNGQVIQNIPTTTGSYTISANFSGTSRYTSSTSNTLTLTIDKEPVNLTLITDKATTYPGAYCILSGSLKGTWDNTPLLSKTVKLYVDDSLIRTTVTGGGGTYTYRYTPDTMGDKNLKAVFEGDSDYKSGTATTTITVNKTPTEIKDATIIQQSGYHLVGKLRTKSGLPIQGLVIIRGRAKDGTAIILSDDVYSDATGSFSLAIPSNIYSNLGSVVIRYQGTDTYDSCGVTIGVA